MAGPEDVERFDRWAATYERHWMQRAIFDPVQATALDLAAAAIPDPAAVLDIGCGTGRLLRRARARFPNARLEGVDAAPEMVRRGAELAAGSAITLSLATAEALPFPAASFDIVFSTMTFHHWTDQAKGIAEVARVLTPRGRWLLADFVARSWMLPFRALFARQVPARRALRDSLSRSGLAVLDESRALRFAGQLPVLAIGRAAPLSR